MELILRALISGAVIVLVTELAKRDSIYAAIIAALPWISLLSFIWLYYDTRDNEIIASLSIKILWMIAPSLAFFPILSTLLRHDINFTYSITASMIAILLLYLLFITVSSISK